jgi:serine/threonine protein kinase
VGVVHRDLKPANIFLTDREDDEPLVKILDFGISKVIDASRAESKLKLTRAGTVVGTPQYMSPEQAQGFSVDERTDVWALGLVLYEMLAGRPAYPEMPTYEQFIIHLVSNPPDPLRLVAPWVPAPLAQVVHECIEHDIKQRIQSCADLARRLLEANPLPGMRTPLASRIENADTWADGGLMSPFAEEADTDVPPKVERAVLTAAPAAEDSLTIDVDVPFEPPPPRAKSPEAPPVAKSGVRAPAAEAHVEDADDAPQFFDRRALESIAPQSGEVPVAAPPQVTTGPSLQRTPAPTPMSRFPLAWAAIAFITVGLVVALALALR